jgi:hypothetical protein
MISLGNFLTEEAISSEKSFYFTIKSEGGE